MNKVFLLLVSIILFSCNPAKRLQRKIENAQKVVDVVHTQNPIYRTDSVFVKGSTVTLKDTVFVPGTKGSSDTIKIATFTHTRDSVFTIKYDNEKLNSYYRELTQSKAEVSAGQVLLHNTERYFKFAVITGMVLLLLCGFLISKIFKV